MTEEERLSAEIAQLEKEIADCISEMDRARWEIEVLEGAIVACQDFKQRGDYVLRQGKERDKLRAAQDRAPELAARLAEAQAQRAAEIEFQASRSPKPDPDPDADDGAEGGGAMGASTEGESDWLMRRRLKRKKGPKP